MPQINLSENKLGIEGAKALAPAIRDSRSLTECVLKANSLGEEGWCAIFDALRDSPQNKIKWWDLVREGIGAEIAKYLDCFFGSRGILLGRMPFDDAWKLHYFQYIARCRLLCANCHKRHDTDVANRRRTEERLSKN